MVKGDCDAFKTDMTVFYTVWEHRNEVASNSSLGMKIHKTT